MYPFALMMPSQTKPKRHNIHTFQKQSEMSHQTTAQFSPLSQYISNNLVPREIGGVSKCCVVVLTCIFTCRDDLCLLTSVYLMYVFTVF